MAIWPFGRKSKKSTTSAEQDMALSRAPPPDHARREPLRESSDRSVPTLGRRTSRKDSQKRRRGSQGKLTKADRPRTRNSEKPEAIPAVPTIPQSHRQDELNEKTGANKSNQQPTIQERKDIPAYYFQNPMSKSSIQPEKFTVIEPPPTLQGKRSANDQGLMRRKSSKRKANDHAREQEIKAMSSPIPIPKRPTSHNTGLLARDSKKIPGGLNRNLDRPFSDVSLPIAESMHSQMSVTSDQHAFKVSAFDALSPRPTIRYSENPRSASGSQGPSRTSTRKDKQPMILEEGMKSRRRIDDLADDMDAGTLKELMERDKRRIDKKRRSEQEKLERRLQRRSEKQREREGLDNKGTGQDVVRKAKKKEDVGLGIGGASAVPEVMDTVEEPQKERAVKSSEAWLKDPSREHLPASNPFHDPVVGASRSHIEAPTPEPNEEEQDVPVLETAKAVRLSSASMSPPISPTRHVQEPSNLSQFSELASASTPDIPEIIDPDQRRDSDSSTRFATSWKSIFRRSDTRAKRNSSDHGRATPSEFSNTSRESVARQMHDRQMPPSAFTRIPRARSGTPIRTQSRFREDLPELPISPPDSRLQSPEAMAPPPIPEIPSSRGTDAVSPSQPLSDIHPAFREEVALSRNTSLRDRANSPDAASSVVLAQSLASVDSEGSWLTGRPAKRSSQQQFQRESASSLQQRLQEYGQSEENIPGTPEEEKYMGSLIPAPEDKPQVPDRKRPYMGVGTGAGVGGDSDDGTSLHPAPIPSEAQEEGIWHSALGKHPTIVRQGPGPRVKSREGLLNDFLEDESAASSPSADSPTGPDATYPQIQRATSVDIGKGHARHISAGSARLLNLPPRSSQEIKRFSASSGASGERSPLANSNYPSPRQVETKDSDVD